MAANTAALSRLETRAAGPQSSVLVTAVRGGDASGAQLCTSWWAYLVITRSMGPSRMGEEFSPWICEQHLDLGRSRSCVGVESAHFKPFKRRSIAEWRIGYEQQGRSAPFEVAALTRVHQGHGDLDSG